MDRKVELFLIRQINKEGDDLHMMEKCAEMDRNTVSRQEMTKDTIHNMEDAEHTDNWTSRINSGCRTCSS